MLYSRSTYQDYRRDLALGLWTELYKLDPNDDYVITPSHCILPIKVVLRLFIKSAGLLQSHGKTREQIANGDIPQPINFVLTSDGAEAQHDSSMQLTTIRIIDESIATLYKLGAIDSVTYQRRT